MGWSLRDFRTHLALCLPAVVWFAPELFFGRIGYFRDTGLYFQPHKALIAQVLRSGHLPEWNPFAYGGLPLLADPNFNTFHPLSVLTDLLPLPFGFAAFSCVCAIFAAYGARALGRTLGLSLGASLACGLFFAWSGPTVSYLLTGQFVASCSLPWLVASGAALGKTLAVGSHRASLRMALWCALAGMFQLLAGTPETGFCGFALAGLLAISEAWVWCGADAARPRLLARVVACFSFAVILAIGLSAIQIIPAALFVRASSRGGAGFSLSDALGYSLIPTRLPGLLVPFFTGDVDGAGSAFWLIAPTTGPYVQEIYLGALVVALAVFAARGEGARRRWPLLAATLLMAIPALGKYTAFTMWMWKSLPPLHLIRFPEKLVVPLSLSVALFAGAGWERVQALLAGRSLDEGKRKSVALIACGAVLIALALIASQPSLWMPAQSPLWSAARIASLESTALPSLALELVLTGAGLLLLAGCLRGRLSASATSMLGALLLLLDLGNPALRMKRTAPAEDWSKPPSMIALLRGDARAPSTSFRVSTMSLGIKAPQLDALAAGWDVTPSLALFRMRREMLSDGTPALHEFRVDRGYSGFTPGAMRNLYMEKNDGASLDLLSVRYAIDVGGGPSTYAGFGFLPRPDLTSALGKELPELSSVVFRVYENPHPMPELWLSAAVLGGKPELLAPRCEGRFVPLLDDADLKLLPASIPRATSCAGLPAAPATAGVAELIAFERERMVIHTDAAAPSLLVASESALPGWRAFVDGQETPVLSADTALRAAAVPAGKHEVVFRYAAPGLRKGAAVSALSLVLFAALAYFSRRAASI